LKVYSDIRFSNHPAIAKPNVPPHAYGNVFMDRAKVLLGSMLGVPSRETIIAFVLMCHVSFANGWSFEVMELMKTVNRKCGR
jgi:hypothetical protein